MATLNLEKALQNLVEGIGDKNLNVQSVYEDVEPLCETTTDGAEGMETTLWDWLYEGEYHTSDTAKSLASEWDKLNDN